MAENVNRDPSQELERIIQATGAFTPQRLTLARELAGLDLSGLAERIEMTSSAVSQFEKGRTRPKVETVIRMALALGVPPDFFSAEPLPLIPLEGCHFRSQRGVTKKERRRVLAFGSVLRQVSDYLQELVNFPDEQLTDLRPTLGVAPDIEAKAMIVRDAWDLGQGPISNVVGLLETKGVLPVEVPGHSQKLDAFSVWVEGRPLVFLTIEKDSASRRRWDAAHELAHLLLHEGCTPGDARYEKEAHAFAGALLLPKMPFLAECPSRLDWNRLRALKRRWGVSLAAIVRRAFDLGIFSEATYRRAYTTLNQRGWRTSEPDEPPMERPTLLHRAVGMLANAGYTLTRIGNDLKIGQGIAALLLAPPEDEQIAFA
jgi:Zn-dependent peptidase ImmA (M78 family)/transcriptional regulator with XRE-family HTH domain